MATEAERAQLHRDQLRAQAAYRVRNALVTLAGSTAARVALAANWRPLWDRTAYIDGVDDNDAIDDIIIDK